MMLVTSLRNLWVSRGNTGRARALHSKRGCLGVLFVRDFRAVSVTLSSRCGVSRNEFLGDVSKKVPTSVRCTRTISGETIASRWVSRDVRVVCQQLTSVLRRFCRCHHWSMRILPVVAHFRAAART